MKKRKPTIPSLKTLITVDKDAVVMKSTFQEAMSLLGTFQEDLKDILSAILLHRDSMLASGDARVEDLQLYEKCEQVSLRQNRRRGEKIRHASN